MFSAMARLLGVVRFRGLARRIGISRQISLIILISLSLLSESVVAHAKDETWDYLGIKGRGYVVCDAILKRLNSYQWTQHEVFSHSWHVVASFPDWKDLPWRDIDAGEHEALIRELVRYQELGADEYFGRKRKLTDDQRRNREDSLQAWKRPANLRLRIARIHLVNWLYDKPAAAGEQTVVQLLFPISIKEIDELKRGGPGKPIVSFRDRAYLVTDDLKSPHPGVSEWHANELRHPRIYKNQVYFISAGGLTVGILKDFGSGPSDFCELQFGFKKN